MTETPYKPTERRPMAFRNWPSLIAVSSWMARRDISPNTISIVGMIACGISGLFFASTPYLGEWARLAWLGGAAMIAVRGLANLLDGMVAIESCKASPVGELYNDVPDRVSDVAMLVGAGYSTGGDITLGYLAACVALFVAYARVVGKASGAPQDYCGPMAKPHRMATMSAVAVFCGLTPTAWQPTLERPAGAGLMAAGLAIVIVLGVATSIRRMLRIAAKLRGPA